MKPTRIYRKTVKATLSTRTLKIADRTLKITEVDRHYQVSFDEMIGAIGKGGSLYDAIIDLCQKLKGDKS